MRLEHYDAELLKNKFLLIIGKHLELKNYSIFFFGSRVEGKGNDRSDIDIGIEGKDEIPLEIISKIREEIDNLPTLYKIEIVDFKKVSPDFREVAFQHIEKIAV